MIVPIADREEWLPLYSAARSWQPNRAETLCIIPHPDDEALGLGGLISALTSTDSPVRVVAVTDGENAYADEPDLKRIRIPEQERALEILGVEKSLILRLGLPDSCVSNHEFQLIEVLKPIANSDIHILAPWPGDFHPDHEACGRAAQAVAAQTGAALTFYFFWTWHRGEPSLLRDLPLLRFELSEDQQRAKARAISCHKSQLLHASGQPILMENLLWPARQSFEIFLSQ